MIVDPINASLVDRIYRSQGLTLFVIFYTYRSHIETYEKKHSTRLFYRLYY